MLKRQPNRAVFASGIEAAILKPWHVDLFAQLRPAQIYCAYDTPDDLEPLRHAGQLFAAAGLRNACYAFVLIGWPSDTMSAAENRMAECWESGFMPFAMLWRDDKNTLPSPEWRRFQRRYCRPAITRRVLTTQYVGSTTEKDVDGWLDRLEEAGFDLTAPISDPEGR
jgi:hypothetical protein